MNRFSATQEVNASPRNEADGGSNARYRALGLAVLLAAITYQGQTQVLFSVLLSVM